MFTYNGVELGELEIAAHEVSSSAAQLHGHGRGASARSTDHGSVRDEGPNEGESSNEAGGGLHIYRWGEEWKLAGLGKRKTRTQSKVG